MTLNKTEFDLLRVVEESRPPSLRKYDQIPMLGTDLLEQVKNIAPRLAGKDVAFVGDHDSTSLLLGLLCAEGLLQPPRQMLLLDFDERLLEIAHKLASEHYFPHLLTTCLYNVFDPLPENYLGQFDVFYTNPPYGASNAGASGRLFITRGCELVRPTSGEGYLLLPDDPTRDWTQIAMRATTRFLSQYGWHIATQIFDLHNYSLDDDPTLKSSLLSIRPLAGSFNNMPWAGRAVSYSEIPHFYGRNDTPPYPRYISTDGQEVYSLVSLLGDGQTHAA